MGRLDLRDTYRDEDYQMGGDVRNPASRQVRTPPAKSGRDPAHGQRGRSVTGTPLSGVGVVGARCPHVPKQMSVDDCIAVAEIGSDAWIAQEIAAGRSGEEHDA